MTSSIEEIVAKVIANANSALPIGAIRHEHRTRRFAMKVQQKINLSFLSFVRINYTEWSPDLKDSDRDVFNKQAARLIEDARAGEGDAHVVYMVAEIDKGRELFDLLRSRSEKEMTALAQQLPVAAWVKSIPGAGLLGLATIVAEAGDLSNYANPAKLWKRLGFAPYDGHAGSTWKRSMWRPRKLKDEEWIEAPFSGERYAMIHQIAVSLFRAQWIGAGKSEDGEGKPKGHYGEIYARRQAHTKQTHPDWTKMHRMRDALRIMMKAFLKDLLLEWHKAAERQPNAVARKAMKPKTCLRPRGPGQICFDAPYQYAGPTSSKVVAKGPSKPKRTMRPRRVRPEHL